MYIAGKILDPAPLLHCVTNTVKMDLKSAKAEFPKQRTAFKAVDHLSEGRVLLAAIDLFCSLVPINQRSKICKKVGGPLTPARVHDVLNIAPGLSVHQLTLFREGDDADDADDADDISAEISSFMYRDEESYIVKQVLHLHEVQQVPMKQVILGWDYNCTRDDRPKLRSDYSTLVKTIVANSADDDATMTEIWSTFCNSAKGAEGKYQKDDPVNKALFVYAYMATIARFQAGRIGKLLKQMQDEQEGEPDDAEEEEDDADMSKVHDVVDDKMFFATRIMFEHGLEDSMQPDRTSVIADEPKSHNRNLALDPTFSVSRKHGVNGSRMYPMSVAAFAMHDDGIAGTTKANVQEGGQPKAQFCTVGYMAPAHEPVFGQGMVVHNLSGAGIVTAIVPYEYVPALMTDIDPNDCVMMLDPEHDNSCVCFSITEQFVHKMGATLTVVLPGDMLFVHPGCMAILAYTGQTFVESSSFCSPCGVGIPFCKRIQIYLERVLEVEIANRDAAAARGIMDDDKMGRPRSYYIKRLKTYALNPSVGELYMTAIGEK